MSHRMSPTSVVTFTVHDQHLVMAYCKVMCRTWYSISWVYRAVTHSGVLSNLGMKYSELLECTRRYWSAPGGAGVRVNVVSGDSIFFYCFFVLIRGGRG